jgi:hypothetical protein
VCEVDRRDTEYRKKPSTEQVAHNPIRPPTTPKSTASLVLALMRNTRRIAHHAAPRPASHAREADPPLCLFLSAISAFCLSFARFFSSLSASFLSFLISLFFRPLYGFPPAAAGIEAEAGAWA